MDKFDLNSVAREKHMLHMLLAFPIQRYLLANEWGEMLERSDWHLRIAKIICHYMTASGGYSTIRNINDEWPRGWKQVHTWLQDVLTDRMDEVIGFPIGRRPRSDERAELCQKFFDFIWDNRQKLYDIIESSPETAINADIDGYLHKTE